MVDPAVKRVNCLVKIEIGLLMVIIVVWLHVGFQ